MTWGLYPVNPKDLYLIACYEILSCLVIAYVMLLSTEEPVNVWMRQIVDSHFRSPQALKQSGWVYVCTANIVNMCSLFIDNSEDFFFFFYQVQGQSRCWVQIHVSDVGATSVASLAGFCSIKLILIKKSIIPGESFPLAFPFISMAVAWLVHTAQEELKLDAAIFSFNYFIE